MSFIPHRRLSVLVTLLITACFAAASHADVRLPSVIGSSMVLQRDRPVPVWGWAAPGEKVSVAFAGQLKTATADADGKWRVDLDALPASSEPRSMVIGSATNLPSITLTNVVVGEVWLCSGQSNMQMSMYGVSNGPAEIAAANCPLIRLLTVGCISESRPKENFPGAWVACTPANVGGFSAVGYFFGRKLFQDLNVPVGLINASWGGTRIEPWTTPAGFRSVPDLAPLSAEVDAWDSRTPTGKVAYAAAMAAIKTWLPAAEQALAAGQQPPEQPLLPGPGPDYQQPTRLYNGMISPLLPYALRGAIWYQGESNGSEGESYYWKMQALINGWRQAFANPDLSFYFVQLASFQADSQTPQGGTGYALVREAQRKSLTIPRTGMAVIIDIGDANNIHPINKLDVGLRLATWALAKDYGKDMVYSGPLYRSQQVESNKVHIAFDSVGGGLIVGQKAGIAPMQPVAGGKLQRFSVAGEDKVWHWADAVIDGATVVVSCPEVSQPVAVRYAYDANPTGCNLYNREGFPAAPFRTDTW